MSNVEKTKKISIWKKMAKLLGTNDEADTRARKKATPAFALIMTGLAVFHLVIFYIYLNLEGILLSFQDLDRSWTFGNYLYIFQQFVQDDGIMKESLINTLIYWAVGYFIIQTLNVIIAYFFYKKIRWHKFFLSIFYMHNIVGTVVMSLIYKQVIGPDGPLVELLLKLGVISERLQFLSDSRYAMIASVGYSLWTLVGSVLLYSCAAMARIPTSMLEAAELDGITPFKEFIHIILPAISGTLSTLYLIGISGILYASGATLFLTEGKYGTMTFSFWMFNQLYAMNSTGTSAALGIVLMLITIPLVFFAKWLLAKITSEVEY